MLAAVVKPVVHGLAGNSANGFVTGLLTQPTKLPFPGQTHGVLVAGVHVAQLAEAHRPIGRGRKVFGDGIAVAPPAAATTTDFSASASACHKGKNG